jgi:2-keto-4-pentenoate hydratase
MESTMIDVSAAAALLLREHDERAQFHSIRDTFDFNDIPTAYDIQDDLVRRLLERRSCGAVGYKIGLTSARMQAMCGVPHPLGGRVLDDRVHASGATISLANHIHPGIECEIAVKVGRDIDSGSLPSTVEEAALAVAGVAPAFELIEDRHADYKSLDMLSLIADNSWNAGIVLGEFRESWPDLAAIEGTASVNGKEVDRGFGRDVLGHPFEPLLWLARHLVARGEALRAGEIVMTGSLIPTRFPEAGDQYRFSLAGLGTVEVSFIA